MTFVILEGLAVAFGVWVKLLETKLGAPKKKRKRHQTGPRDKPRKRRREGI